MTEAEVNHILYEMTYDEYVDTLKAKYGAVPKDYFYFNKKGKLAKTSGITRGSEGLYIHHIYECYFIDLSTPATYLSMCDYPQKYPDIENAQKAENLVYGNLMEHLILHIKIALEYQRQQYNVGIAFITRDINNLFDLSDKHLLETVYRAKNSLWKQAVYQLIKDDYEIYVWLVKICINDLNIPITQVCSTVDANLCPYPYQRLIQDVTENSSSIQ